MSVSCPRRPDGPIRAEGGGVPDQPELDALFLERRQLAIEIEAHQAGQVCDLFGAALPVLRRESVEGQNLDAVGDRRLHRAPHRLGARLVPGDARTPALLRPAAVPVHDDRDVTRDPTARGLAGGVLGGGSGAHLPRISLSLASASSSISLIVSSVSFCTACSSRFRSSTLISCFF